MNSSYREGTKDFTEFLTRAESLLRGHGLDEVTVEYYRENPAEWHKRTFDVLMAVAAAGQRIHGRTQATLLAHATKLSPGDFQAVLKSTMSLGPVIESAVRCWEVSRDLAYEEFGSRFGFPPPRPARDQRRT